MDKNGKCKKDEMDYFEKHSIPWITGHLSMRSIGLQVFIAIQGGLIIAWSNKPVLALPIVGIASCISFYLWDKRIRFVLQTLIQLGEDLVDINLFGKDDDGKAKKGMYNMWLKSTKTSENFKDRLKATFKGGSHTRAVEIMIYVSSVLWLILLCYCICTMISS